MSKKINIAGFDPASRVNLGCAVLRTGKKDIELIDRFTHVFKEDLEHKDYRLVSLEKFMVKFLADNNINIVTMERSVGFGKSFVRAQLNEVTGVIKLCALREGIEVFEYSPMTVKKEIAGSGKASKKEIKEAVMDRFDITKKDLGTEHECDAIAVAGTHIIKEIGKELWFSEDDNS